MTFTLTAPGICALFLGAYTILGTYLLLKLWRWSLNESDYSTIAFAVFVSFLATAMWLGLFAGAFH